ncbi:MAG: HAMP domain-containing histidine kinase, partial [Deltaproteobacteria bacterium]|nr:HAMP domain-containing histidine kinase [Deltaproteobacteria bacterium]
MDRKAVEQYRLALFGRMVMGVAHEIDNHLSVVLGFSELIQLAAGKEQKVMDGAGKILSAGEKIGAIVHHFSRYVRPHAPSSEPFVPAEMIPEILLFSRYDLGRDNVTVLPVPEVPPGILHADRRDFGLALLALLFNAAEAMSGTGGDLGVRVSIDDAGWQFTVSDKGTGIPAGFEEKIFEAGFTTRTGTIHMGMGLPVARYLVEQAGGTLQLANAPACST